MKEVKFILVRTSQERGSHVYYYHDLRRFLNMEKTEEYGPMVREYRDFYFAFHKQMLGGKTMESNG